MSGVDDCPEMMVNLKKVEEEFGATYDNPGPRGGQPECIRYIIQGGSVGSVAFRVGDVGHDPPHGMVPKKFSTQGHATYHWEAANKAGGGGMELSAACERNRGGGIRRYRGLHPKEAEHDRTIYCDKTNSGTMRAIGAEAGILGFLEVVGTRDNQPSGGEGAGGGSR